MVSDWEISADEELRALNQARDDQRLSAAQYRQHRRELLLGLPALAREVTTLRDDPVADMRRPMAMPMYTDGYLRRRRGVSVWRSWKLAMWCACMLLGVLLVWLRYAGQL